MRVAFIRSDISREYLNDIENTSQRDFSAEPAGQSRYFHLPTTADLTTMLKSVATLSVRGTDTSANVNTSAGANVLRIRAASGAAYTVINVTSGASTAKTQIVSDLNAAFTTNSLPFVASVQGTNQLQIDTVAPDIGPTAFVQIDTVGNGSTLNTPTGLGSSGSTTNGLSVAALTAAVYTGTYPGSITGVNVSSANLLTLSTWTNMPSAAQTTLVSTIQNTIAPQLVESGPVLLSFQLGNLFKMRSSTFQPGGTRINLAVGAAVICLANDGVTLFTM